MDFKEFEILAAPPSRTVVVPPAVEAAMKAAIGKGPLALYERRQIGHFTNLTGVDALIDYLNDGLSQFGLRVVTLPSEQMDGGVSLAITRL